MPQPYEIVQEGTWVQPLPKGYRMACCDCGLVHRLDFRIATKGKIQKVQLRAYRDEPGTRRVRAYMKRQKETV